MNIDERGNRSVEPSDWFQITEAAGWVLLYEESGSLVDRRTGEWIGLWYATHSTTGRIVKFHADACEEDMVNDPDWGARTFLKIITEME